MPRYFQRLAVVTAALTLIVAGETPDQGCSVVVTDSGTCTTSANMALGPHVSDGHHRRGAAMLQFAKEKAKPDLLNDGSQPLLPPLALVTIRHEKKRRQPLALVAFRHERKRTKSVHSSRRKTKFSYRTSSRLALSNALDAMGQSANFSIGEIEEMISKFISEQQGSTIKCSAQLLQAKHELNQLHNHIQSIAQQVNVTQTEIRVKHEELQIANEELNRVEEWKTTKLQQCNTTKTSDRVMYETLKAELQELYQIANYSITVDWSLTSMPRPTPQLPTPPPTPPATIEMGGSSSDSGNFTCENGEFDCTSTVAGWCEGKKKDCDAMTWSSTSSSSCANGVFQCTGSETFCNGRRAECQQLNLGGSSSCNNGIFQCSGSREFCQQKRAQCYSESSLLQLQQEPTSAGIGEVQALVHQTRDAAGELVVCLADNEAAKNAAPEHTALLQRAHDELRGSQAETRKGDCDTSSQVQVTVGNATQQLSPGYVLAGNGSVGATHCRYVNPAYIGAIWLICRDGQLSAEAHCVLAGTSTASECNQLRVNLQTVYAKTYVELARLVSSYEALWRSTACESTTQVEYISRKEHAVSLSESISTQLDAKVASLQDTLQPQLSAAQSVETTLRSHVQTLTQECEALPATESDLDKVREAIAALKLCASEGKTTFQIPLWTGVDASFDFSRSQGDDAIDQAMRTSCSHLGGDLRPAETSEIEQRTIEDLPLNNTFGFPLLGTCPNCEGTEYEDGGHGRVCWQPGQPLNTTSRSTDCQNGRMAVICVKDQADIR